jgi:D-glucosaminate-6-phosphate ammonia-lyase
MHRVSRRDVFRRGGAIAAGMAAGVPAGQAAPAAKGAEVYTRLGVRPFINCTATLTINGGSMMLPEVVAAIEQASHYAVNLDELMEKAGSRLAELLQVPWGFVTAGCAAALTHATAACIVGSDPEKMRRLPNLAGLKDEVIMPRESRVVYDHAVRTLGCKIIEVNSTAELRAAIGRHTAMIEVLGNHFGSARLDLKDIAPIAKQAGVPVLVDAAADYLIVPNPYIALGADLVADSGGNISRGPQNAGLLVGRRDLVRAAWANSAPHHAFGRAAKVSKEQIVGMLRAVEIWRTGRKVEDDFREWKRWYAEMIEEITKVPGVKGEIQEPMRGGPFPTLKVSWTSAATAGQIGHALLEGEPRIMTHAEGEGKSFLIRPVAMKPGEHMIVARRLREILVGQAFSPAGAHGEAETSAPSISGAWDVEIQYEVGAARHKLILAANGTHVTGSHEGWATQGDLKGDVSGDRVTLRSTLPGEGNPLTYIFRGQIKDQAISGDVDLGEYGRAKFHARRHA